jgi:prepilin-type N-terminal cleavage/methylation domain-containing protein
VGLSPSAVIEVTTHPRGPRSTEGAESIDRCTAPSLPTWRTTAADGERSRKGRDAGKEVIRRRPVRDRGRDRGFGLVEFMVAASVIVIVALGAVAVLVHTAESLGVSRQRQAAITLATQALEQLRGLPYTNVTAGLRMDDLSNDPDISLASGVPRLVLPSSRTGGGGAVDERLVVNNGTTSVAPLYPHRMVVANSTFRSSPTLSVFVTLDAANPDVYDLTAVVRWTPTATEAEQTYVQRTKLFSPPGSGGA